MSLLTQEMPQEVLHENDVQSVFKSIAGLYSTLTPQLRKAADYVLENPVDIALFAIRKSSGAAGVTPSTMTRLAKMLGFERYNTFKEVFKQAIHTKSPINYGNRVQLLHESPQVSSSNKIFQKYSESTFQDLEHLFTDDILQELQLAAGRILKAKNVYALGFRDAFACAHHFVYVGHIAFPNFRLIRGQEGSLLSELAKIDSDDVVVVFGSDPYAIETVNSVKIAKEQGACVITITDDLRSPLVEGADMVFIVETGTPHFFPTILSTIALVEALLSECVAMGGREMVDNISCFEARIRRLGGYHGL